VVCVSMSAAPGPVAHFRVTSTHLAPGVWPLPCSLTRLSPAANRRTTTTTPKSRRHVHFSTTTTINIHPRTCTLTL
jgi:hypothetical protein